LDVESFRTSLIMAEQGNLQFTSTIPIAGNSLTESLAKALGIASAKAEEIKKKVGLANTTEYPNIRSSLLPVLNNLTAEIKNILKFHSEHSDKQVERVVLCGGGARLNNLAEFLAQNLADAGVVKVEQAKPWQNLPQIAAPPLDESTSLSFVTAIGLAIRGVDYEVD
jgi:Tfp pilus assembly PilM family ATPase